MILSDRQIKTAIDDGDITIEPFDPAALGTNSYDVHLGKTLVTYILEDIKIGSDPSGTVYTTFGLDCRREPKIHRHEIPDDGMVFVPGRLYLGSTVEYTRTEKYVPFLDGKSSIGRLGITIHCTAGRGDVGFAGHWTMEIHVVQPVRVYAGMPIGQLIYFETGAVNVPYDKKPSAKYRNARNPDPQPSRMWRNFK